MHSWPLQSDSRYIFLHVSIIAHSRTIVNCIFQQ
uniref:Uncharacterized protein n=1 Tax=Caudovirales sp. ctrNG92 TaxID=2827638 RepID=A0A8S5SE00_9CAUD|nr:MAG TPA: hypothetical protein [Caudovirales sp. ctrNG92]